MAIKSPVPHCCGCGQFIGGSGRVSEFTPDSHRSRENISWLCQRCEEPLITAAYTGRTSPAPLPA